jgi:sulfofructose kinase
MISKPIICLGSATWDTIFQVDTIPAAGIKVLPSRAVQAASGMATAAAITIARLGGQVALWSRIGDDVTADRYLTEVQREGVNVDFVRQHEGVATPFSSIMVDQQGERAVIPFFDLKLSTDTAWLPLDNVASAACVMTDMRWVTGAAVLLAEARRLGIPALLDADTAPLLDLQTLVPLATHVLFSEPALALYANQSSLAQAILDVASQGTADVVAVTLGAVGVLIWTRATNVIQSIAAPAVVAVDTLNAGDVWHGAFAWGITQNWSIDKIVRLANLAAAMKCEVFGGRLGTPNLAELTARANALGWSI